MKSLSYFFIPCCVYSVILLFSCTKNEVTPTIMICDTCKHELVEPVSVSLTDSSWSVELPGYYTSNLYQELRKLNDTLRHILYIQIISGDYEIQVNQGQTISFYQGALSFKNDILAFKAFYNQLPFRSLDIRITAY